MRKFKVGDRIQITTTTPFYKSGETGIIVSLDGEDKGKDSQYEVRLDLPCYNSASGGRWYVLDSEMLLLKPPKKPEQFKPPKYFNELKIKSNYNPDDLEL